MSPRRMQRVTMPQLQDRTRTKDGRKTKRGRPWVIRLRVEGKEAKPKYFETKKQAENYAARLRVAINDGLPFDPVIGEPVSWQRSAETCASWAQTWFRQEYGRQPATTQSTVIEALERALPRLVSSRASEMPRHAPRVRQNGNVVEDTQTPSRLLREYVRQVLCRLADDAGTVDPNHQADLDAAERWLSRWSLPLSDVDEGTTRRLYQDLGLTLDGKPLAGSTTHRHRSNIGAMFTQSVEDKKLERSPWPTARQRRRQQLREVRNEEVADPELIFDSEEFAAVIAEIPNHQPGSLRYVTYFSCMYLGGLRPQEVHPLRKEHLTLPDEGWGAIRVRLKRRSAPRLLQPEGPIDVEATKNRQKSRTVPIPPELVRLLKQHLARWPDQPLFCSQRSDHISGTNLSRAWTTAKKRAFPAGHRLLDARPYDLRHSNASAQLADGMPPPTVAERLGHSTSQLVSIYWHAFKANVVAADERLAKRFAGLDHLADLIQDHSDGEAGE
jgi:integrase